MSGSVTARAESNGILFDIISQPAAPAEVADLKILRCAAVLAVPPVAREHLAGELAIRLGFKPQSWPLPFEPVADPLANVVPLKPSPEELKIAQLNAAGESPGSTQRPAEKEPIVDWLESVNESETASEGSVTLHACHPPVDRPIGVKSISK